MHLGNGAVTPGCAVFGLGVAGSGMVIAAAAARKAGLDRGRVQTAAVLGAGIFAAQAFNVPVFNLSSAHLVGGVLAAWVLGPAVGTLTMAAVLLAQALVLGDGGLMALGVNIINMGLLPAALVMAAQRWRAPSSPEKSPSHRATLAMIGVLSALAVIGAAALIAGEVALFRSGTQLAGWSAFAGRMLGYHALIAVGEGLVALALASLLLPQNNAARWGQPVVLSRGRLIGAAAAALAMLTLLLPFSSRMPDGYETAAAATSMGPVLEGVAGVNHTVAVWQNAIVRLMPANELLAALAGTGLLVLALALGLSLLGRRAVPVRIPA